MFKEGFVNKILFSETGIDNESDSKFLIKAVAKAEMKKTGCYDHTMMKLDAP